MTNFRKYIFSLAVIVVAMMLFSACTEEVVDMPVGKLRLSIGHVSTDLQTRATPAELPKPMAEHFHVKVQRKGSSYVAHDGKFVESIDASIGVYDVTAFYGENVVLGKDAPYYYGTAEAEVKKDQSTSVSIPCRVANALVSVKFGIDEDERVRFERFYTDFGLLVRNGEYSMSIGKDETATSIYFPAGTSPELVFYGTLKEDAGRTVSVALTHKDLPTVFKAADHAKVTITLPDPQSSVVVNIAKVELEQVTLDETIPLSWLPVPSVTPSHNYNAQGILLGTDLTFSNTYPEMIWEARVSNEQGDTIRRIVGTGELLSAYNSSTEWPYLPKGKYRATYFLHTEGSVDKVSSRAFTVDSPQIIAKVDGYTSYDKYLAGDIEAANAADGYTLYDAQVSVNISPSLAMIEKYNFSFSCNLNGEEKSSQEPICLIGNKVYDARMEAYTLSTQVSFAGEQASGVKDFYITGVPFRFEPPTTETWEKSGDVTDEGEYARFGRYSGGSQSLTYNKVAIPAGTHLSLDYKFNPYSGAVATTFTIYAGEQSLVSGTAAAWYNSPTYEGIEPITIASSTTSIRCHNSYGAGETGTDLYRVALSYRQ